MSTTVQDLDTFAAWWDYIKTDSPALKLRYFLRNYQTICPSVPGGGGVQGMLVFMKERGYLSHCRGQDPAKEPIGNWILKEAPGETQQFEILFRVDPNTPTVNGVRRGVPSICVCLAIVDSQGSGNFTPF